MSVHSRGLIIGRSSPAYVVLKADAQFAPLASYAVKDTFPVVGIAANGRVQCFTGAQLLTGRSFSSSFTEGSDQYRGLLLSYTNHFTLSGSRVDSCRSHHSLGAILATVSLTKSSAKLQITCLIRNCNAKFAAFKPPNTCKGPVQLLPGVTGCSPAYNGFSKAPGGLTDTLTIPLKGVSANVMRIVLVVNGKNGRLVAAPRAAAGGVGAAPAGDLLGLDQLLHRKGRDRREGRFRHGHAPRSRHGCRDVHRTVRHDAGDGVHRHRRPGPLERLVETVRRRLVDRDGRLHR